jgi:hypothetical protein
MALNEGRRRTGVRWRNVKDADVSEDVKFFDPNTMEQTCTLSECVENGNLQETVTEKQYEHRNEHSRTFIVEDITYKEKRMECSKCGRTHYLKNQIRWNAKQKNNASEEYVIKYEYAESGKMTIDEAASMRREHMEAHRQQVKEEQEKVFFHSSVLGGYNSTK